MTLGVIWEWRAGMTLGVIWGWPGCDLAAAGADVAGMNCTHTSWSTHYCAQCTHCTHYTLRYEVIPGAGCAVHGLPLVGTCPSHAWAHNVGTAATRRVHQDGTGVSVQVQAAGAPPLQLRGSYLVAADGAHSPIRCVLQALMPPFSTRQDLHLEAVLVRSCKAGLECGPGHAAPWVWFSFDRALALCCCHDVGLCFSLACVWWHMDVSWIVGVWWFVALFTALLLDQAGREEGSCHCAVRG
jgi:2-polyprenyl-6-methoxyphenol hydroxylase-like FAD-dependent oxidoreductase